jgi:hypothetical protein
MTTPGQPPADSGGAADVRLLDTGHFALETHG